MKTYFGYVDITELIKSIFFAFTSFCFVLCMLCLSYGISRYVFRFNYSFETYILLSLIIQGVFKYTEQIKFSVYYDEFKQTNCLFKEKEQEKINNILYFDIGIFPYIFDLLYISLFIRYVSNEHIVFFIVGYIVYFGLVQGQLFVKLGNKFTISLINKEKENESIVFLK